MGMEVVDSNLALDSVDEANIPFEVGKLNIKFGSHGAEDPAKGEPNKLSEPDFPKDVVDEWPEPAQIHSWYIVKYRAFEDPNLKAKFDVADKELQKNSQARSQIFEKLKIKRAERAEIRTQIHSLSVENKQFRSVLDEKRKEMEPLQQALGKLRGSSGARDNRGAAVCSSEAELNDVIKSLQYRIQHESIPLKEEKQILREIKLLEGTREKVIANAAERARIQDSLGEKESIQDQVKLIGVDLDGVRKEKQVVFAKIKQLDEEKLIIEKQISALEEELTAVTEKRDKILENVNEMRRRREDGNSPFYNNRTILAKARVLASNKDVDAVKELSHSEVEKFMALWNGNKAFRKDYESRIAQSLDMRQLSKDGRLRNFNEKPLVPVERPVPSETEVVKTGAKQNPKEEVALLEPKVAKAKSAKNHQEGNKKTESTAEKIDQQEASPPVEKPQKDPRPEIDEKQLKELKREEEIAKRNQAEERKRKLAEKAAAKAAIKAQKEAEKKLKEREKRARKKSGAAVGDVDSEEPTETVPEATEPETAEDIVETPVPQKSKQRKERMLRQRAHPRGPNSLPKAMLKRKQGTNYFVWGGAAAAAAAALVVILLVVVGYSYLS